MPMTAVGVPSHGGVTCGRSGKGGDAVIHGLEAGISHWLGWMAGIGHETPAQFPFTTC